MDSGDREAMGTFLAMTSFESRSRPWVPSVALKGKSQKGGSNQSRMILITGLFHHCHNLSVTMASVFPDSKEVGKNTVFYNDRSIAESDLHEAFSIKIKAFNISWEKTVVRKVNMASNCHHCRESLTFSVQ